MTTSIHLIVHKAYTSSIWHNWILLVINPESILRDISQINPVSHNSVYSSQATFRQVHYWDMANTHKK